MLLIFLAAVLERRAYAYTDPGSSLLLFQSVSSVGLAVVYFFRRRVASAMRRLQRRNSTCDD